MKKLGFAVVGSGIRGADNATAITRSRNARLVTVMDVNPVTASALGGRLGVPALTGYEEVLHHPEVEVVFINTPHHLHAARRSPPPSRVATSSLRSHWHTISPRRDRSSRLRTAPA